jgi:hypothetical protein
MYNKERRRRGGEETIDEERTGRRQARRGHINDARGSKNTHLNH